MLRMGNANQESALDKLLQGIRTTRKISNPKSICRTAVTETHLWVWLDLQDFPVIRIGGRGGFEMPDIRTHPPHSDRYDGIARTAYEACLKGDEYVRRQGSGAAKNSAFVGLPWQQR